MTKDDELGYLPGAFGDWNDSYICIDSIDFSTKGKPKVSGSCIGILKVNDQLYFLSEDDDRYSERCIITVDELKSLHEFLVDLLKHLSGVEYDLYLPDSYRPVKLISVSETIPSVVGIEVKPGCVVDINLYWLYGWSLVIEKALNIIKSNTH